MSQPPPTPPPQLTVPVQEAGWVFRLEMMFSNLALGYFRYILVAVGVGLVGVLIYGLVSSSRVKSQRAATQALTDVRVELRASLYAGLDPEVQAAAARAGYGLGETFNEIYQLPREQQQALMASAPELMGVQELLGGLPPEAREELFAAEDDLTSAFLFVGVPNDVEKKAITDSAAKLVAVADEQGGVAAGMAYLDAADWYARAGDAAGRRGALEKALATGLGDPIRAAAVISLAGHELDAGQALDDALELGTTVVGAPAVGVAVRGHQDRRFDLAEPVEHPVRAEVGRAG